jgi:DNA-directed RNA polymerase sigma subunit (sigma70/sigma32)
MGRHQAERVIPPCRYLGGAKSSVAKQSRRYRDEDRSLDLYLREIGSTPLITAQEEVRLARRIKQGDMRALEKLTKANLRFVVSVQTVRRNTRL